MRRIFASVFHAARWIRVFVAGLVISSAVSAYAQTLNVLWQREGAGEASRYGYRILPLGDQNDDGFADWAVMCRGGAPTGDPSERRLEFFHGGNPPSTTPYWIWRGEANVWDIDVYWTDVAGDVNRDGHVDWMISQWHDSGNRNVIALFFGGPDADTIADWTLTKDGPDPIEPIGDYNGDSYDDIYVYNSQRRCMEVYFGGQSLDTIPNWTLDSLAGFGSPPLLESHGSLNGDIFSDWVGAYFSSNTTFIFLGGSDPDTVPAYTWPNMEHWPLEIVNDLNGDSFDELVYSTGDVHFGGPEMSPTPRTRLLLDCDFLAVQEAVSTGDVNRDGYNDVVFLSNSCDNAWWGVLSLYLGHPWLNPQPVFTVRGRTEPLNLVSVWTAAGLGDINGDGVDDFAVGAWDDEPAGLRGQVVILGGDTTLVAGADEPVAALPRELSVQVYPNPFNSSTTVELDVPLSAQVLDMKIFNTLGQTVHQEIISVAPGRFRYLFDASSLTTGLYFLRVDVAGMTKTMKLVLMR